MSRREIWAEIYRRFDPNQPATEQSWRADRALSPAGRILGFLSLSTFFEPPKALLLGTVGTGKSTELLRVAEGRASEDLVVHLDLVRHFEESVGDLQALRQLSSWEVCFLVGLGVMRAAQEQWDHRWSGELVEGLQSAWQAVARLAGAENPPTLDIPKLLGTVAVLTSTAVGHPGAGGALKLLQASLDAMKWNVPIGGNADDLRDQDAEVRELLDSVNVLIHTIQDQYDRRILVIVDGLDRIQDLDRADALFIKSELISRLDCALLVTGPTIFRHEKAVVAIRGFEPYTLVNEPVLDHRDPSRHGPGIAFFGEVFQLRARDLGDDLEPASLVPDAVIERIAYYSGGRSRDFVRMIRMLAREAILRDIDVAERGMLEPILRQERLLLERGLHAGDIALLLRVMEDPEHQLPKEDKIWELLRFFRLLPYPNRSEWYYPHPLLTLGLLHPDRVGSKGSSSASP